MLVIFPLQVASSVKVILKDASTVAPTAAVNSGDASADKFPNTKLPNVVKVLEVIVSPDIAQPPPKFVQPLLPAITRLEGVLIEIGEFELPVVSAAVNNNLTDAAEIFVPDELIL